MADRVPQSATKRVLLKAYLQSDGISDATGKTIAVTISKNGAAFGNPSAGATNATEIANGWYYVDLSTTDAGTLGPLVVRGTASGIDPVEREYEVASAHNAGFDALPNVAAEAAGGLYTRGSGAGQINQPANGQIDANTVKVSGTAQTARDLGASVLLSAGTGTGQLDFTSGVVKANATQFAGQTITAAAGVTLPSSVASPTNITAGTITTATNLTNAPTSGDFTAAMKTSLNAATPAVTVSDKTGFSLSAAGIQAIWDALTSALTTVGSIGKLLVDKIDATISSRSTYAGADTSGTTTLLSRIGAALTITGGKVDVNDRTGFSLTAAYDAAKTAAQAGDAMTLTVGERTATGTAVWATTTRELTSGTNIALAKGTGVTGFNDLSTTQVKAQADQALADVGLTSTVTGRIDAAVSSRSTYAGTDTAGTTTLLGRLTAVRAGNLDQLDAAVSSRLAASSYTAPDNADIAAIKTKTDALPAAPAATGDIPTAVQNAAALLDLPDAIEIGLTMRQAERLKMAALVGKASGMDMNLPVFRNYGDTKDRINAVTDEAGNRLDVTVDVS